MSEFVKIGAGWDKKGKREFISCLLERDKAVSNPDGKISFLIFRETVKLNEKSPDYSLVQIVEEKKK